LQHIGGALKNLIKTHGLERQLNQQKAMDVWGEVVGKKIMKNTEPLSVEFGVLTVKTSNSVWRQELQLQKDNIVQSINKKLTKKTIKDVRFI
tara:strand:+ start:1589 stop:1864 length:276 start_codon:yes stop_codon:yes gene_type:complete